MSLMLIMSDNKEVYKGWNGYYYCPAFILSRKENSEYPELD